MAIAIAMAACLVRQSQSECDYWKCNNERNQKLLAKIDILEVATKALVYTKYSMDGNDAVFPGGRSTPMKNKSSFTTTFPSLSKVPRV